jgi:hypothetical protein
MKKKVVFIKLDESSSLFKALKQRNLIDYRGFLSLYLNDVPRIGESFTLPYDSMTSEKNEILKLYLTKRPKNKPIMKVEDLIIDQVCAEYNLYYLKCSYINDTNNWL